VMCAVLREHGVPARVRFGFAGYLAPTHWQSHVICEHADLTMEDADGAWTRTDPDLGRHQLGEAEFVDAVQAWRAAPADVDLPRYGYGPSLRGRWAVRWELTRDLAALTGFEPLTSDVWGVVATLPEDDPAAADGAFRRVAGATSRRERLALAADPAFAVPRVITAAPYLTGAAYEVDLTAEGSR
jgi:hypothetical protein